MSYEAKARGVTRAMRLSQIRKLCPDAVILSSDYEAYRIYARRMYNIVRRYANEVEEYSIDECFADITGMDRELDMPYADIAAAIKKDLHDSLGLSFSVGLSVNKVLAKLASKKNKPSGLTVISMDQINMHLKDVAIGKVWGIGSSTTIAMKKRGIVTALDLAHQTPAWVAEHFDRPVMEIYQELRGAHVMQLASGPGEAPHSIQRTQTFKPVSKDPDVVFSELSRNVENAAHRLRGQGLFAGRIYFFLKTQEFEYSGAEIKLARAVSTPTEILAEIKKRFASAFKPGLVYRATGVTLSELRPSETRSDDLFGGSVKSDKAEKIFADVDRLTAKYGENAVFLGSSLKAVKSEGKHVSRHKFGLAFLGEVK